MSLITNAYIGTENGLDQASSDFTAEPIELQNGLHKFQFPRELTINLSKDKTYGDGWGIFANDKQTTPTDMPFGIPVVYESASKTLTEVVSDRQMATNSNLLPANLTSSFTAPNGSRIIQHTLNMVWLGYEESYSFTIKFEDPDINNELKPGGRIFSEAFRIAPEVIPTGAVAGEPPYIDCPDFSAFDKHLLITSVNKTQNSDGWHTAAVEASRFIPATDTASPPLEASLKLWTSPTLHADYMGGATDTSSFYKITQTINLTSQGNPTLNESLEVYPDSESLSYMDTNYTI